MLRRFVRKPARGDSRRSCLASCRHKVLNKLANVLSERQTHNEDMEIHILASPGDHSAAVGLVLWNQGLNICVSTAPHSCPPFQIISRNSTTGADLWKRNGSAAQNLSRNARAEVVGATVTDTSLICSWPPNQHLNSTHSITHQTTSYPVLDNVLVIISDLMSWLKWSQILCLCH